MFPDAACEATLPGACAMVTGAIVGVHPRAAAGRGTVCQVVDRLSPALALRVSPLAAIAAISLEFAGGLLTLLWFPLALSFMGLGLVLVLRLLVLALVLIAATLGLLLLAFALLALLPDESHLHRNRA